MRKGHEEEQQHQTNTERVTRSKKTNGPQKQKKQKEQKEEVSSSKRNYEKGIKTSRIRKFMMSRHGLKEDYQMGDETLMTIKGAMEVYCHSVCPKKCGKVMNEHQHSQLNKSLVENSAK